MEHKIGSRRHAACVKSVLAKHGRVYLSELSNVQSLEIGEGATIHSHVWIGDKVRIGNYVTIQAFAFIPNGVEIGNSVFIGPRVTFTNDKKPPSFVWSKTVVEDGAAIGAGSVILPGVTVGAGCLIGAGSVVTKDVPPGETWAGNPAKKLTRGV